MIQFFASGGQRIGASASASVLPMNIQGWFPLGLTGLISLQSKGLSRVFSNTTVQKHQFFSTQPFLWSNSHIHTWLFENPLLRPNRPLSAMSLLFNMLSRFVKFCEFEQVPGDGDGQESLACCSPWGHKDHTQTPLSNWTPPLHNNNNGIKNNIKASTLYNRELLLNENRVSVWDDEKVLRMNGGDVCTILWMYWMPLNRSLENNSNDNFYAMCFLPQWKKM